MTLPTAWLQLKYNKIRSIVALSGIIFAVVMIFMQLGFRAALFDSAVRLHQSFNGDIFFISPRSTSLTAMENFPKRQLEQALAFDEVDFVTPIYLGFAQWRNPQTRNYWRPIYVIGFELRKDIFNLPEVNQNLEKLKLMDTVLFDEGSRTEFGEIVSEFKQNGIVNTEVGNRGPGNRKIKIVGLFRLGTSFGADGNLITSDLNFLRIFSQESKGLIEIGMVKLKSKANVDLIIEKFRKKLPNNIKIVSKQEFIEFEKEYWQTSTAIGFIFNLSVSLAIIVGIVIVYQVLYTNVADYLPEYATLKAIGYPQIYLLGLVFQEAMILGIGGYFPGIIIAFISYEFSQRATSLPIMMNPLRAMLVFFFTLAMCFIAGGLAISKLQDVDPADVFNRR